MLYHQNPVLFLQRGVLIAKAFAQVHDRDNLSPQVNYALQIVGRVGDSGDLRHSHDFVQRSDGHAIGLAPYLETDDMEFAIHTCPTMLVLVLLVLVAATCRSPASSLRFLVACARP